MTHNKVDRKERVIVKVDPRTANQSKRMTRGQTALVVTATRVAKVDCPEIVLNNTRAIDQ